MAMTRDDVLGVCSAYPGATEDYPFGDDVAVFKVAGRMFALVSLTGDPGRVNLKCDPGLAIELRARWPAVRPGYHQNKRHWNTVELDGSIDDDELRDMITHSYDLVAPASKSVCVTARPRSRLSPSPTNTQRVPRRRPQ